MKRSRDDRIALAARKKKAFRSKAPFLAARISQNGVGGAKSYMPRSTRPYAPELKYSDIQLTTTATDAWQNISTLALSSITQGPGSSQRIGRKIRLKGIILRGRSELGVASNNAATPYTIDFLMDKQPNGTTPVIALMYKAGAGISLPNPDNDERFKWLKRYSKNDPNTNFNIVDIKFSCNELVTYDGTTGGVVDMATNNLLVNYCSPFDASPTLLANLRVLYIDE